jgi:cell division protease FtsH
MLESGWRYGVAPLIRAGSGDDKKPVARVLRNGLFPLIVIVLLVYLASQTLVPDEGSGSPTMTYSQFLDVVDSQPELFERVMFDPDSRGIEADLRNGRTQKVHYTTDESAFALEQSLRSHNITFDSKGSGDSAWWSILTYLLPFVLFFGFWTFLMRQVQGKGKRDERPLGLEPPTG